MNKEAPMLPLKLKMPDPAPQTACLTIPSLDQRFVLDAYPTTVGMVPKVSFSLSRADRIGFCKARGGIGRMRYTIQPGLYALGEPSRESPVFVTANYKMSFDRLRHSLPGRSGWILVLDTKGINVWCAAGKGTFGTVELIRRIQSSGLKEVVSHRRLILPQLSAPGISAHVVKRASGFKVTYGPVRAEDLPAFLDSGLEAIPELRTKNFSILERAELIPMELVASLKALAILIPLLFILTGLIAKGDFWSGAMHHLHFVTAVFAAVAAGAVLTPLLLPWLPGRAFSLKGLPPGIALAILILCLQDPRFSTPGAAMETASWMILTPTIATYLSMNFSGASTYTSLSGVKKEMRGAIPLQLFFGALGLALWMISLRLG